MSENPIPSRLTPEIFFFHTQSRRFIKLTNGLLFGRNQGDLQFPDDKLISRLHARIFLNEGYFWIEDLDTKNYTLYNGERVVPGKPRQLFVGDKVDLGGQTFIITNNQESAPQYKAVITSATEVPPSESHLQKANILRGFKLFGLSAAVSAPSVFFAEIIILFVFRNRSWTSSSASALLVAIHCIIALLGATLIVVLARRWVIRRKQDFWTAASLLFGCVLIGAHGLSLLNGMERLNHAINDDFLRSGYFCPYPMIEKIAPRSFGTQIAGVCRGKRIFDSIDSQKISDLCPDVKSDIADKKFLCFRSTLRKLKEIGFISETEQIFYILNFIILENERMKQYEIRGSEALFALAEDFYEVLQIIGAKDASPATRSIIEKSRNSIMEKLAAHENEFSEKEKARWILLKEKSARAF